MKIRIQNYQSIKDTEIQVKGFTVVAGETNVGKSALVRSVKGLMTNQGGNHFIHKGKGVVRVELNDGDKVDVIWEKGKGVNQYTVNGDLLSSVNRGRPDFLEGLGFGELVSGSDRVVPQIADQHDSSRPFLLDKSGSFIAEAICSVTGIERVNPAIRMGEKRLRDFKSQLKVRTSDLEDDQAELLVYEGLDDAVQGVELVKGRWKSIQVEGRAYQALQVQQKTFQTLMVDVATLDGINLVAIPSADSVEGLLEDVKTVGRFAMLMVAGQETIDSLTGVSGVSIPESVDFRELHQEIVDAEAFSQRLKSIGGLLQNLIGVEDVEVPQDKDVSSMVKGIQRMELWLSAGQSLQYALSTTMKDLTELNDEIHQTEEDWTEALGTVCPLCEREVK